MRQPSVRAPHVALLERLQRRTDDVSDADADIPRRRRAQEIGLVDWQRVEASSPVERVLQEVAAESRRQKLEMPISLERARAAKRAAAQRFRQLPCLTGVGITRIGGEYGIKLNLSQP